MREIIMKTIGLLIPIALIFGLGFGIGGMYNEYLGSKEKPLDIQLYQNMKFIEVYLDNISWVFDGKPSDYNLTGDPLEDKAFLLEAESLAVIDEKTLFVIVILKLKVRYPYIILDYVWMNYTVEFWDYNFRVCRTTEHYPRFFLFGTLRPIK